jgi:hypothetical protein
MGNGLHLREQKEGKLLCCHLEMIEKYAKVEL